MVATLQAPIYENIQLTGISWQTYQALEAELVDRRLRLTYNRGYLKILGRFVETLAEKPIYQS
jgi:hypothetical protein